MRCKKAIAALIRRAACKIEAVEKCENAIETAIGDRHRQRRLQQRRRQRRRAMGQILNGSFSSSELKMRKTGEILEYSPQPADDFYFLDTEVDQRGNTTVNHVFKPKR